MDSVAIVVLNWNGIGDTVNCITSLSKQTYKYFTIILVDNGSTEQGTAAKLDELKKKYTDKLHIIRNPKNDGFAGGVNIGIRYALENKFTYVALFNNDATAASSWLSELVDASRCNQSAITTGLLLHADGKTIDSTGDWYSIWGLPFPRDRNMLPSSASEPGYVFGATGGASLYECGLFKHIGLFDESFFAYYEDVDVCFRAQLVGKKVYYTDKAIAYHKQGATSSKLSGFSTYQTFKNLPLLFWKNVPTKFIFFIGIRFFIAYYLMLIKALLSKNALSALRGWVNAALLTPAALHKRITIQGQLSTSKDYIKKILWNDLPPDQTGLRKLRSYFVGTK